MKLKILLTYISVLALFCGCTTDINHELTSDSKAVAAIAPIEEETQSQTEEKTEPTALTIQPDEIIFNVPEEIEVYEEITLKQLAGNDMITILEGSTLADTSEVGIQKAQISYMYNGEKYENTIEYTVTDTTPPTLLNSGGSAVAELGSEFDLNDYVGFADNYDRKPVLTYTGEVDTSVCGTYPLTATATDSSGNETTWDLSVKVMETIPQPEVSGDPFEFEAFTMAYGGENRAFGIDVSKWQGDIDFEAVKQENCQYVIMRIGSYYDDYTLDSKFYRNMENALAAGIDVGVYIYTTANTEEEARDNARWIAEILDGQELDFPVVFDWEHFGTFQQYEMSIHDLNQYFEAFADELDSLGYDAMLYSSKNFLNNFWYEHKDYPIWLAHYTDETDYTGEHAMWQMSSTGRIDGIDGDVDFNILYTDKLGGQ